MEVQSSPGATCRICGSQVVVGNPTGICEGCFTAQSQTETLGSPYAPQAGPIDPDNPSWGAGLAVGTWGFSVAVSLIIPLIAVVVWLIPKLMSAGGPTSPEDTEALILSPTSLLIQVVAIVPTHLITLAFCWAVVTRLGKQPFFESLGWKWTISPTVWQASYAMSLIIGSLLIVGAASTGIAAVRGRLGGSRLITWAATIGIALAAAGAALLIFRLFKRLFLNPSRKSATLLAKVSYVVGVQVAVLAVSIMLEKVLPQKEDTAFDLLLKSSQSVRTTLALLAVFTAPIVEEVVYRGVLYSGLRPRVGVNWTIAIVTLLFAGVHLPQYWGAWAGLTGLTILSLILTTVRASTGSLLPCIAIHTLNNLIGAIQILSSSPESQ